MRIEVVGKHLDITPAIRAHAEEKCQKLLKHFDLTQLITVLCEGGKRGEFEVEIVVDVEKHDDFVSRAKATDLYAAMDLAVAKSTRQLTDFKEILKTGKR